MDCRGAQDYIRQWLDGRLDEAEKAALDAHISDCPSCDEYLGKLTDDPAVERWLQILREARRPEWDAVSFDTALSGGEQGDGQSLWPGIAVGFPRDESPTIQFPGPPTEMGPLGQLGSYHIIRELGSGATGVVFLAHDDSLGRLVAIKVLRPELAADSVARSRFVREARTAVSVRHEHVVAVQQ